MSIREFRAYQRRWEAVQDEEYRQRPRPGQKG